ncbi:MAG: hypothetical protein LBE67_02080 [Kocuria palustris]|nr:hypothetical protein [Kocuria palustris]
MALPPLSRLYAPRTLAFAVASGAEEMIPYHRARGRTRAAIIAVPGLTGAGLTTWWINRKSDPPWLGRSRHRRSPRDAQHPGQPGARHQAAPREAPRASVGGLLLVGSLRVRAGRLLVAHPCRTVPATSDSGSDSPLTASEKSRWVSV